MYVFTQPLRYDQDLTQSQFLNGVKLAGIQSVSSPRLVASPSLKNPVYYTIYP